MLTTRIEPDAEQLLRKRRRSGELIGAKTVLSRHSITESSKHDDRPCSVPKGEVPRLQRHLCFGPRRLGFQRRDDGSFRRPLGRPTGHPRRVRTIHITHGDVWDETTVTKFRTMEDRYRSGGSLVKISPVDKSSYTTTTTIQSGAIVTAVDFGVPSSPRSSRGGWMGLCKRRGERIEFERESVLKVRSVFKPRGYYKRVVGGRKSMDEAVFPCRGGVRGLAVSAPGTSSAATALGPDFTSWSVPPVTNVRGDTIKS